MEQEKATATLYQEHRYVEKVVAAMVVIADRLETGQEVKGETLRDVIDFMRLVYQSHERKEEQSLFPALQRRGVSVRSVPSRMLVEDHDRGKVLVSKLEAAAKQVEAGGKEQAELAPLLRELAALYPLHIWQEDLLLFYQADRVLSPEDNRKLLAEFAAADQELGGDVRRRLEQLSDKVQKETW